MRCSTRIQNPSKAEKEKLFMEKVEGKCSDDLSVNFTDERGRGIVVKRDFEEGEYVAVYEGDLITHKEGERRYDLFFCFNPSLFF